MDNNNDFHKNAEVFFATDANQGIKSAVIEETAQYITMFIH